MYEKKYILYCDSAVLPISRLEKEGHMGIISIEGVAMPADPLPQTVETSEKRPEEQESPEPPPMPADSGTSVDTYA